MVSPCLSITVPFNQTLFFDRISIISSFFNDCLHSKSVANVLFGYILQSFILYVKSVLELGNNNSTVLLSLFIEAIVAFVQEKYNSCSLTKMSTWIPGSN